MIKDAEIENIIILKDLIFMVEDRVAWSEYSQANQIIDHYEDYLTKKYPHAKISDITIFLIQHMIDDLLKEYRLLPAEVIKEELLTFTTSAHDRMRLLEIDMKLNGVKVFENCTLEYMNGKLAFREVPHRKGFLLEEYDFNEEIVSNYITTKSTLHPDNCDTDEQEVLEEFGLTEEQKVKGDIPTQAAVYADLMIDEMVAADLYPMKYDYYKKRSYIQQMMEKAEAAGLQYRFSYIDRIFKEKFIKISQEGEEVMKPDKATFSQRRFCKFGRLNSISK